LFTSQPMTTMHLNIQGGKYTNQQNACL